MHGMGLFKSNFSRALRKAGSDSMRWQVGQSGWDSVEGCRPLHGRTSVFVYKFSGDPGTYFPARI